MSKSHHARLFEELMADYRQRLVEAVTGGVPEGYYAQYVGEIRGIDNALKYSEEADSKLTGE